MVRNGVGESKRAVAFSKHVGRGGIQSSSRYASMRAGAVSCGEAAKALSNM